jgi:hypothetical protein
MTPLAGRSAAERSSIVHADQSLAALDITGRSPAGKEFLRLRDEHVELVAQVRAIERERDTAAADVGRFSNELQALERRRAAGETVDAKKAEAGLLRARAAAGSPWHERISGAEAVARQAAHAARRFAVANHDQLRSELVEDAMDVAGRCDAVLEAIVDAHEERARVASTFDALSSVVGLQPRTSGMPESKLGKIARDAEAIARSGGEAAPIPRRQPIGEAVA